MLWSRPSLTGEFRSQYEMQNDEVICQVLRHKHCSFMTKFRQETGSFSFGSTEGDLGLYKRKRAPVDVSANRKAVVIHVPYRLRKAFRKIHLKLMRELEKKFSGKEWELAMARKFDGPAWRDSANVYSCSGMGVVAIWVLSIGLSYISQYG